MRVRRLLLPALLLVLGAAACSTIKVSTDYDRTVDFRSYSTFDLLAAREVKNALMRERIEGAIAQQLQAKGLRRTGARADLLVATHFKLDSTTEIDTTHFGYAWGRWGYWGYRGPGAAVTTVRQVPVGTLIIDLVDARERKLVWQGVASDTLRPRSSAAEKDEAVREAVAAIFASYPPGA